MSDIREHFVQAAKKRWADPDYRAKQAKAVSEAMKQSWARRKAAQQSTK
jgi:hypothetical protein